MTLSGLIESLKAMRRRNGWHRYGEAAGGTPGVFTCCDHCPRDCHWASHHPAPCKQCIREMELVAPLPGDVTRLISYQDMDVHTGTIYRAAGWRPEWVTKPRQRDRTPNRAGTNRAYRSDANGAAPASSAKTRWEVYP